MNSYKKNEADNTEAIKYPHLRKKSYSAAHLPYDRTGYGDLNPSGRGMKER